MLETVSFMYFLLFIYTFYLYKLDVSRNNFLLNSQNINTVSSELIDTQSAENCKGFSETVRQLPGIVKIYSFARLRNLRLRNAVKYPMCAFSSVTPAKQLDPWFLTGFIDGEGSFIIKTTRSLTSCWSVIPVLQIELHHRDEGLLKQIQAYFGGVGLIRKWGTRNVCSYTVSSIDHLTKVIIPHFDRYPLITQKISDYMLWRQVIMMMVRKEHLTQDGLEKIVALKANLNLGLSDKLKADKPRRYLS